MLIPALSLVVATALVGAAQDADWAAYGRDPGGERFSPLSDVRRENVASLEVAWTFRTGDAYSPKEGRPTAHEATPLHLDDTLFLSTPLGRVIALDPITGKQRWAFDAKVAARQGLGRLRESRRVGLAARWTTGASSSRPSTHA